MAFTMRPAAAAATRLPKHSSFEFQPFCGGCATDHPSQDQHAFDEDGCAWSDGPRNDHGVCAFPGCPMAVVGRGTLPNGACINVCSVSCGQILWMRQQTALNKKLLGEEDAALRRERRPRSSSPHRHHHRDSADGGSSSSSSSGDDK